MLTRPLFKLSVLLALTTTILPATGDQLYVRNRPFKGAMVREGKVTWIELQSLATALGAKLATAEGGGFQLSLTSIEPALVPAGKVAIGSDLLDARDVNGTLLVSLEGVSALLGLKVIPNKALGTVDVNFATAQIAAPTAAPASSGTVRKLNTFNPTAGTWLTSYSEAVSQSKSYGKPILMDFTGSDWCGWCQRLKAEVFDMPEFKKWATDNVILLEVDFPRNTPLTPALKRQNDELAPNFVSIPLAWLPATGLVVSGGTECHTALRLIPPGLRPCQPWGRLGSQLSAWLSAP